jgi:streptogramin lyase
MARIAAAVAAFLTVACAAGAATHVRVSLAARPGSVTAGRTWTARLTVRPRSYAGAVRVAARGPGKVDVRAAGSHGSYRARLVFPAAGRWTLTARAGGSASRLATVTVRRPAKTPLLFTWPTSVDVESDASLLVVENGAGRVDRVRPATGKRTVIASGLAQPYAVATGLNGAIYVSNDTVLQRIDGAKPTDVLDADSQIGPIAVGPDGSIAYTTGTQAFERSGDVTRTLASSLGNPHGIAVTADGRVLVSDTGHDRVLRIDPQTGATGTLIRTTEPRGIAVARDGSLYLVEAGAKRVGHYSAAGARLGGVGPVFDDPYDVDTAADGSVYVVETAASGTIVRVAPNGSWSKLTTG